MKLPKAYNSKEVEDKIYQQWEQSGFFNPDNLPGERKNTFTISLPPPNATGQLHLGHAVMLAVEDIFIRYARMQGKAALWLPGTDHASIATESVVIKKLRKEEKMRDPRAELGREKLLEKIAGFVEESRGAIKKQFKKMGSSCDWSRERYTLDPALNRCVNEVFKKMYDDGLIYRGTRIINWDPKMQTTVSDDEIEREEEKTNFYYFKYGPFTIGTARPETKFGDKYIVMHPDDKRYQNYKDGDKFETDWLNGKIIATVIKDNAVDQGFGTGAMTITPWHDVTDFEIAERHNLDKEQIIDFNGRLLPIASEFAGLKIEEARPKIVEKLKAKGLLVKIDENHIHAKAKSYRGGVIEPQIKEQWFINVNKPAVDWKNKKLSLKEVMQDVIRSGDIKIVPTHFEKVYFHWIDNLKDWCISRQIWWGHRIPVFYRKQEKLQAQNSKLKSSEEIYVGHQAPPGENWTQDPDTLDTWFSSALWTWSTLIDKKLAEDYSLSLPDLLEQSPDFKRFHPTQIMETGYDILFFWVARMILATTYATGQIPFETVYLHGLVRDRQGQKMSKSKPETMIDPLDIIAKYGTDALRLAMVVGQTPGTDQRLYEEKIKGYRNFVNKVWNISRFIIMQTVGEGFTPSPTAPEPQTLADKWILSRLSKLIKDTTDHIENYRSSQAIEGIYNFAWAELADWYLEISKPQMQNEALKENTQNILNYVLTNSLKLFHPFMPFVTEYIWSLLKQLQDQKHKPEDQNLLLIQSWPRVDEKPMDEKTEKEFSELQNLITKIRNWKAEQKISFNEIKEINLESKLSAEDRNLIENLAKIKLTSSGLSINLATNH